MAVTPAQLIAIYPEFAPTNTKYPAVVQGMITRATRYVDPEVVGDDDEVDELVMWKACALLADSQFGHDLRLVGDKTANFYDLEFRKRMRMYGSAWRTVWTAYTG